MIVAHLAKQDKNWKNWTAACAMSKSRPRVAALVRRGVRAGGDAAGRIPQAAAALSDGPPFHPPASGAASNFPFQTL